MSTKRVLVLGGAGFVGRAVVKQLQLCGWATPVVASRNAKPVSGVETIAVDSRDPTNLAKALEGIWGVVNCVAGDGATIAHGAQVLTQAALAAGGPRIVHMSTMSVYGSAEGLVDETYPLQDDIGWYGHAKIEAENHMRQYAAAGGEAVILRPGCVVGAASALWVDRVGDWLRSGRVGDMGNAGDGPANLVDVEDVAQAAVLALKHPLVGAGTPAFNLASPDSPRWNVYFADLALAIGATPLRTLGTRRIKFDAYALGVPVKVLERVFSKLQMNPAVLPVAIPPSLLGLWKQQITLSSREATAQLRVCWTPYETSLHNCAEWLQQNSRTI